MNVLKIPNKHGVCGNTSVKTNTLAVDHVTGVRGHSDSGTNLDTDRKSGLIRRAQLSLINTLVVVQHGVPDPQCPVQTRTRGQRSELCFISQ